MNGLLAAGVVAPFLLVVTCVAGCLRLAQRKDAQLMRQLPDTLSYRWGYFLGYSGMIMAAVLVVAVLVLITVREGRWWFALVLAYAAGFGLASYGVVRRRKWGWLIHIPLSLNPGLWAFNSVYVSNRWRELR